MDIRSILVFVVLPNFVTGKSKIQMIDETKKKEILEKLRHLAKRAEDGWEEESHSS